MNMILTLLLLIAIVGVALGHEHDALGARLIKRIVGHDKKFLATESVGELSETTKKLTSAGLDNHLLQAIGYAENKCASGSNYFFQSIAGGQCAAVGDATVKSQMFGCTPPSDGSTKWTLNIVQFESNNCGGEPLQVVAQFHDENDCTTMPPSTDDDSDPYAHNLQMKCALSGSPYPNAPSSFMTALYSPNNSQCDKPLVVQGLIAGRCVKGSENGVPTNTSTSITCLSSEKTQFHSFKNVADCTGKSIDFTQPSPFPTCTANAQKNGDLNYEKTVCYSPSN